MKHKHMTRVEIAQPYRKRLIAAALRAQKRAYAPYSHFKVGAAVLLRDGRIVDGCNSENAAFGSTTCAEDCALAAAVARGAQPDDFVAIAVVADTSDPVYPCGGCRQRMAQVSPVPDPMAVFCCSKGGQQVDETTLAVLLPHQFPSPGAAAMLGNGAPTT